MAKTKYLTLLVAIGAVLLVAGWFGATYMAENMAEQKINEFFAGMEDVASAEYGEVEVSLFSHEAVVHDLAVTAIGGRTVNVERFVLRRYEEKNGLPHALDAEFEGVEVPVNAENFGDSVEDVRKLGYDTVHCDYAVDYEYAEEEKSFELRDFSLTVRDAMRLSLSLRLANVNLDDLVQGGPSAMLVALNGASLRLENDSLMDRALGVAAEEEGLTEDEVMDRINQGLGGEIERARVQGEEFLAQVLEEVRAFLERRKAISITLQPEQPVAMLQILGTENPAEVVRMLGVEVVSE